MLYSHRSILWQAFLPFEHNGVMSINAWRYQCDLNQIDLTKPSVFATPRVKPHAKYRGTVQTVRILSRARTLKSIAVAIDTNTDRPIFYQQDAVQVFSSVHLITEAFYSRSKSIGW